jgi:hypothetical protein
MARYPHRVRTTRMTLPPVLPPVRSGPFGGGRKRRLCGDEKLFGSVTGEPVALGSRQRALCCWAEAIRLRDLPLLPVGAPWGRFWETHRPPMTLPRVCFPQARTGINPEWLEQGFLTWAVRDQPIRVFCGESSIPFLQSKKHYVW